MIPSNMELWEGGLVDLNFSGFISGLSPPKKNMVPYLLGVFSHPEPESRRVYQFIMSIDSPLGHLWWPRK